VRVSDIYCYTDGSCGSDCSGIGWHIEGEVEVDGCRTIDENITSMESELYAFFEGVRVASVESDCRRSITVSTDCRPLRNKICAIENGREDWEQYRQSARWLLNKFDSWDVQYVDRDQTSEAHELARRALKNGRQS